MTARVLAYSLSADLVKSFLSPACIFWHWWHWFRLMQINMCSGFKQSFE